MSKESIQLVILTQVMAKNHN